MPNSAYGVIWCCVMVYNVIYHVMWCDAMKGSAMLCDVSSWSDMQRYVISWYAFYTMWCHALVIYGVSMLNSKIIYFMWYIAVLQTVFYVQYDNATPTPSIICIQFCFVNNEKRKPVEIRVVASSACSKPLLDIMALLREVNWSLTVAACRDLRGYCPTSAVTWVPSHAAITCRHHSGGSIVCSCVISSRDCGKKKTENMQLSIILLLEN